MEDFESGEDCEGGLCPGTTGSFEALFSLPKKYFQEQVLSNVLYGSDVYTFDI